VLLFFTSVAHAAGYSLDVEMVRTGFSLAPPGTDSPEVQKRGHVRAGAMVQYELNPLVLVVDDVEVGSVVGNRFSIQAGASVDLSRRLAVRAALPLIANFGSDVSELSADGFGAGDIAAGARFEILNEKSWALGAHADLFVPISGDGAYMGEVNPRFAPGVAFALKVGDLRLNADMGAMLRGAVSTQQELSAGQELTAGLGVGYSLLDGRVTPRVVGLARVGLQEEFAGDWAAPVEVLAGAQGMITKEWYVDAYGGRGLTSGYGATDARAIVAVTYNRMPPKSPSEEAEPVAVFQSNVTDEALDKIIEEPEPEPEPEPPKELATVTQEAIVIRDPLQFGVGTERILPESQPTLDFVAKLMAENPDIQSLIIEGHASGEGSFEYNYELSRKRSEAVFRELVESGVSPDRLSYRSFGEVRPVKEGDDAANRRVVFTIAHRLRPGEPNPGWATEIILPWNGKATTIPGPSLPADAVDPNRKPPAPIEQLDIDESQFENKEDN
jgi:outer membrane protein OmpA-like peptidoglycan-associated protein